MLLPAMEQEVQKMFKAGIIAPIRFSDWISNLVPTRKKTGEIRLCVDLRNLNQVSLKDNYPLPKMDHILQRVVLVKRVLTLRNLVQTLERRTQDMQGDINKFQDRFIALQNRGLPSLLEPSGKLLSHDKYAKRVNTFAQNQISEAASSSAETGPITGQILYNRVENLFFIMNEITHLFDEPPHFYKYTEANETMGSILKHQLPAPDVWEDLIRLLLNQSQ